MIGKSQPEEAQPVQVVETDVFDSMNETRALIAERAYLIYQSRGGGHGSDQDDWFSAEGELLPKIAIEYDVKGSGARLTAHVPGFDAKDLEVDIGHRRAVICGVHSNSSPAAGSSRKDKKVMRVIELPFDVDPVSATAKLQSGILHVFLPWSR